MSNRLIVKSSQQFAGGKLLGAASGPAHRGQWQSSLPSSLQETVIVPDLTPYHRN